MDRVCALAYCITLIALNSELQITHVRVLELVFKESIFGIQTGSKRVCLERSTEISTVIM